MPWCVFTYKYAPVSESEIRNPRYVRYEGKCLLWYIGDWDGASKYMAEYSCVTERNFSWVKTTRANWYESDRTYTASMNVNKKPEGWDPNVRGLITIGWLHPEEIRKELFE